MPVFSNLRLNLLSAFSMLSPSFTCTMIMFFIVVLVINQVVAEVNGVTP
jgi:hypothetical protein